MAIDFSKADLSFAGCGFMCVYHIGVSAALKEYAPHLFCNRIYGASAGAIAAAALLCDVCISEATSAVLQVISEARAGYLQALSPTFDLLGLARDAMERMLPVDAHVLCSGRLFISLTRYSDCKNVVISEFNSKEDLIQAIICSCYIPWFCGFEVPVFHGVQYIDGGFSDNQPRHSFRLSITISPFSGESDICPMDAESASLFDCCFHNTSFRFTISNFYRLGACFAPPSQDICSRFCRQGFIDTLRFLTKNAIAPCIRCLTVQSNLLPLPLYGIEQMRYRRRMDSECGMCLNRLDNSELNSTELFPAHLQKTLENTRPMDNRLYNYIRSLRVVRYTMPFVSPFITPINYSLMILKLIKQWQNSDSRMEFFVEWIQKVMDCLLKEIEERNLLCTPKFNYRKVDAAAPHPQAGATVGTALQNAQSMAQIYETDDHANHLAYLNDNDSMHKVVEYAEKHNAILAYYYTNNLDELQICEIFDIDRKVPRVKCHSTAILPTVRSSSPDHYYGAETTSGSLTAPASYGHRRPAIIGPLPEEDYDEKEDEKTITSKNNNNNNNDDDDVYRAKRKSFENAENNPKRVNITEEVREHTKLETNKATADKSKVSENFVRKNDQFRSRLPISEGRLGRVDASPSEESSLQCVPPDPDASSTSKNEDSNASKRDACCSPVRHLNKPTSASSSSSQRWRGSAGRLNVRAGGGGANEQRATRRHTTIGTSGGAAGAGARKLVPYASTRALTSTSPLALASSIGAGPSRLPLYTKSSSTKFLKTVHSSDSDDEVDDEDELFVVSNRRPGSKTQSSD